jgi:hypothetical protein
MRGRFFVSEQTRKGRLFFCSYHIKADGSFKILPVAVAPRRSARDSGYSLDNVSEPSLE